MTETANAGFEDIIRHNFGPQLQLEGQSDNEAARPMVDVLPFGADILAGYVDLAPEIEAKATFTTSKIDCLLGGKRKVDTTKDDSR